MNNIDSKITQCEKDLASVQANLDALKKEKIASQKTWQIGEIICHKRYNSKAKIYWIGDNRVILANPDGDFIWNCCRENPLIYVKDKYYITRDELIRAGFEHWDI
jgi:hypothetical protein